MEVASLDRRYRVLAAIWGGREPLAVRFQENSLDVRVLHSCRFGVGAHRKAGARRGRSRSPPAISLAEVRHRRNCSVPRHRGCPVDTRPRDITTLGVTFRSHPAALSSPNRAEHVSSARSVVHPHHPKQKAGHVCGAGVSMPGSAFDQIHHKVAQRSSGHHG